MFRRFRMRGLRRGARRPFRLGAGRRFRRRRFLVGGMTMLLVGGAAYKIATAEVESIQEYAGRPPEDLSPQELEQAMDALGIPDRQLTQADRAAVEAEAADTGSWEPADGPAAPASPTFETDLEKLASLRDRGIITEEDFQAKKKQILGL